MKKRFIAALCLIALIATALPIPGAIVLADTATDWEVRFVLNGGTMYGTTADHIELVPKSPANSRLARLPESPRRDGYVFGGWFNEPTFDTRFQWRPTMAAGNNNFNIINADKTVYAIWQEKEETVTWALKYQTNFDEPFNEPDEWILDDYTVEDDPIRAQDGIGYHEREIRRLTPANATGGATAPSWYTGNLNQYGGGGNTNDWDFYTELSSFTSWRKSHTYGEDNWLTIQQYGRGLPGASAPGDVYGGTGGRFEARNGKAVVLTETSYDAATITNTNPLPPYYRLEATVSNIEAGGRAIDPVTGREPPISSAITAADWATPAIPGLGRRAGYNGYQGITTLTSNRTDPNYRSAGPWSISNSTGLPNNTVAENGMYFLGILEYPNVRPNNNKHIHWHRKVVFDSDNNQATKSAGTGNAGWSYVWTGERFQGDGSRYVTMIWCGPDTRNVYAMNYSTWATWVGNMSSLYYTYTQVGTQYNAVYMTDKYLPGEDYTFVIERTPEYYMLSMTGNFYHAGQFTYEWTKFHFGYDDPKDPRFNYGEWTWHFNQTPEELRGLTPPLHPDMVASEGTVYFRDKYGVQHEDKMWPVDSGYPDSIIMGIPHINYYDAYAEFSDIKLYVAEEYLYSLDVTAGLGGSVSGTPAGDYNAVTSVSLSAVADPGYAFDGWTFVDVDEGLALDPSDATLNFTMPIRDVTLVANFVEAPTIVITGPDSVVSGANETATYTISAINVPPLSAIDFSITVDGKYLTSKAFTLESGFTALSAGNYGTPLYWTNLGDIWTGKAILANANGPFDDFDIFTMTFAVTEGLIGPTDIVLNYVITSFEGDPINAVIANGGVVTTVFEQWYSKFDLNKDGVVDLNDLTFALQYMLIDETDVAWAQAEICNVQSGDQADGIERIDINDLVLILANYTVPYYS